MVKKIICSLSLLLLVNGVHAASAQSLNKSTINQCIENLSNNDYAKLLKILEDNKIEQSVLDECDREQLSCLSEISPWLWIGVWAVIVHVAGSTYAHFSSQDRPHRLRRIQPAVDKSRGG